MSILNRVSTLVEPLTRGVLRPLLDLLVPNCCPVCGREMGEGQRYICTRCRLDAPLTRFIDDRYNPMAERILSMRPEIEHVSALIYYIRGSDWRDMIRRFKYRGEFVNCLEIGEWMGLELRESAIYREVDCVMSVPLHPLRQLRRGYNQSDYLAEGISRTMGVEYLRGSVYRKRLNPPQARSSRDERWGNVEDLFGVRHAAKLAGRNILLVDDVFTTGATILSCAESILAAAPTARLWITTFAASNREFGFGQK